MDSISAPRRATFHRSRSSGHYAPPAHLHTRVTLPLPFARDSRTLTYDDLPAATPALFFEFVDDRGGTNVQDTGGVANPAGIHGHVDELLLHPRRFARHRRSPAETYARGRVDTLSSGSVACLHRSCHAGPCRSLGSKGSVVPG